MLIQMAFNKLMGDKNYISADFVNRNLDVAPEFVEEMKKRHICSTIQCFIGGRDDIKGVLTIDKTKEASQWAEYEIEVCCDNINFIVYDNK